MDYDISDTGKDQLHFSGKDIEFSKCEITMPFANGTFLNPPSDVRRGRSALGYRWDGTEHKKLVLCFDGTGNKFQGTSADSNILKIYRMLDREDGGFYYYQVTFLLLCLTQ